MKRIAMVISVFAACGLAACKSDDASMRADETPATQGAVAGATTGATGATNGAPAEAGTFGGLISGATMVTVTERPTDGPPRTGDAAWIAKFTAAVGVDTVGEEGVPKCLPKYSIVFANDSGELATFGAVCSDSEAVIVVRDGLRFEAVDGDAARTLLQDVGAS